MKNAEKIKRNLEEYSIKSLFKIQMEKIRIKKYIKHTMLLSNIHIHMHKHTVTSIFRKSKNLMRTQHFTVIIDIIIIFCLIKNMKYIPAIVSLHRHIHFAWIRLVCLSYELDHYTLYLPRQKLVGWLVVRINVNLAIFSLPAISRLGSRR